MNDFKWYRDWQSKLNGGQPMPVAKTPSSGALFGQAADNTKAYADQLRARGGNTGALDFGAMARDLGRQQELNTRTTDIKSLLSDLEQNRRMDQERAASGLSGMQNTGRVTSEVEAQHPLQAFANHLKDVDYVNSEKAQLGQGNGVLDALLSGAGSFGGQVLGSKLFGPGGGSSNDEEEWNMLPPEIQQAMYDDYLMQQQMGG